MSKPKVSENGNKIYIKHGDKRFQITVTDKGISVDLHTANTGTLRGYQYVGTPFYATWDEMIPKETDNNDG